MKVAFCASEMVPFAKTGGLADVVGALPLALEDLKHEVIVILPRYKSIQEPKFKLQRISQDVSCSVIGKQIKVYFIEHPEYFQRDNLYGDKAGDYKDNLDRFSYYCKRALGLLREINFKAQIIHCHDWQSGLVPVYLKNIFAKDIFYKGMKTIFTIHNIGYQGLFAKEEFPKLGLNWELFNMDYLEFYDKINILKGGIVSCDIINTVSNTYSKEIQTKEFGFGLEGILARRKDSLFGIINGLDYSIWNPESDSYIAKNYSVKNIQEKAKDKADLQKFCKLPAKKDVPLFGIVSRLAEQKGFDILADAIQNICKLKLQLVILGTGDQKYHILLDDITKKYPEVVSLNLKFDDALAHKIYAGSDIFLMPSKYEPCGLGQLISLSYGTIPLVFKTGGLADTVTKANGFVFDDYSAQELLATIKKSIKEFGDEKKWLQLTQKAMQYNFSWEESAKKYVQLYEKAARQK
ncbi:MAG: glycogen synthase GlgA [Candidatus Omnitrophica bacterium]|nr:glycogen synthase GlgA [Candidatus Omnitrophota bacterium]